MAPREEERLNEDQQAVYNKVVQEGKSIFFTGCAGTGKSFLLKRMILDMQKRVQKDKFVVVTASTGRAAFSIGGTTLHNFAGVGLALESSEVLANKVVYNKKVASRWNQTEVLVVDEVSMITGTLLDKLEYIARRVRKSTKPFGGIQLVLTGDLLQLPPVTNNSEETSRIFECDAWKTCIDLYMCLNTIVRQTDISFIRVLTCIRVGEINDEVTKFITEVSKPKTYEDDAGPVNLYAVRSKTDKFNLSKLKEIELKEYRYVSEDDYMDRKSSTINSLNECPVPPEVVLKVGAQVMLVKNLTQDLVNGTVGVVTSFINLKDKQKQHTKLRDESIPVVRFSLTNGRVLTKFLSRETWERTLPGGMVQASRTQIPLILAWAVTIHKSQGQTIQRLRVDLSDVFESGQVYTALSRAVSVDGLEVTGFNAQKVRVDNKALSFYLTHDLI